MEKGRGSVISVFAPCEFRPTRGFASDGSWERNPSFHAVDLDLRALSSGKQPNRACPIRFCDVRLAPTAFRRRRSVPLRQVQRSKVPLPTSRFHPAKARRSADPLNCGSRPERRASKRQHPLSNSTRQRFLAEGIAPPDYRGSQSSSANRAVSTGGEAASEAQRFFFAAISPCISSSSS